MQALYIHLLIAAACVSVGAMAARFPSVPSILEIPESAALAFQSGASSMKRPAPHNILPTSYASNLEALLLMHPEVADHKHGPIRISTKFMVSPSGHKEFIEEWMRFEKKSSDIKGVAHLSLNKIVGAYKEDLHAKKILKAASCMSFPIHGPNNAPVDATNLSTPSQSSVHARLLPAMILMYVRPCMP
jgi:hypothetical protein